MPKSTYISSLRLTRMLAAALLTLSVSAAVAQEPEPPCAAPEYRQFDFWIGEWQVTTPDGKTAGTNRIEKVFGGCALQENWEGASGSRGSSYNIWAARRGVWHQTWVDNSGTLLLLDGSMKDDKMVLRGTAPGPDGTSEVLHEISWQLRDDGTVLQHWRASGDDGKSWRSVFEGTYSKK